MKNDRVISLNAAIEAVYDEFSGVYCNNCDYKNDDGDYCEDCHRKYMKWAASRETVERVLKALPDAQSELEDKIREIGYTGREGRIYIGGRLFAVRELPQ